MSRDRWYAVALAAALATMALFGLAGSSRLSGPVVLQLGGTHGVHRDDLFIVAAGLVGLACCWRLWHR